MPGASANTVRVRSVNANWKAGADRNPGSFEFLIVTEDGERHTVAPTAEAVQALVSLVTSSDVLLWDPDNRTLIVANIVGETVPADWSSTG